ncbi:MAG: Na/Pi symporter [Halobacteriovoraceae bacterium]|nr:Na/Pi symporter [Halobacteriovoraceae bacterium]
MNLQIQLNDFYIALTALTAIILFLFGLDNFSKEIQRISGERFRKFLTKSTKIPIVGVIIGAIVTSIIQSSSATSVITIGLVNAGVITFRNSLGIIFGANIGTTITGQLVALKLTAFAPAFIILGFFLSLFRSRYSFIGKSIFYFGFVFFSLNLISSTLTPLQSDERVLSILTNHQNIFLTILAGALFTAVVQSSSVTTGLAVILTQNGIMSLENAIPIIMGANIGTTVTALFAMINMDISAKKTAFSHFLFNIVGTVLFLPIVPFVPQWFSQFSPAIALANFHLTFNILASALFTLLLNPFAQIVEKLVSGEHHLDFPTIVFPKFKEDSEYSNIDEFLGKSLVTIFDFLKKSYSLTTLSIETNYKNIYDAVLKRNSYMNFLKNEFMTFFSQALNSCKGLSDSQQIITAMNRYEYLYQIQDSIEDLTQVKEQVNEMYIEIESDVLLQVREISGRTLTAFDSLADKLKNPKTTNNNVKKELKDLQDSINEANKDLLKMILDSEQKHSGVLKHFLTHSQRIKDKLSMLFELI